MSKPTAVSSFITLPGISFAREAVDVTVQLVCAIATRIFSALFGSLDAVPIAQTVEEDESEAEAIKLADKLNLPHQDANNAWYHYNLTLDKLKNTGLVEKTQEELAEFMAIQACIPDTREVQKPSPKGVYAVQKATGGPINHYYTAPDAKPNPIPGDNQLPERTMIPTFCLTYGTSGHRIKAVGSFEQQKWQAYQQALLDRGLQVIPLGDDEMIVL